MSALLSTSYRKHITWNGYPADVVKSGLQKYIRRSVLEKALYCAAELDLFKEAENTKEAEGIRTNFLHRLMIIFMEDVENLALFDTIYTKMNLLFQERQGRSPQRDRGALDHGGGDAPCALQEGPHVLPCSCSLFHEV